VQCFRTAGLIPSMPVALVESSEVNALKTSSSVILIESIMKFVGGMSANAGKDYCKHSERKRSKNTYM